MIMRNTKDIISTSHKRQSHKNKKKPIPLASPRWIGTSQSRRKARRVTSLFHQYTRQREQAQQAGDTNQVQHWDHAIQKIGGRSEYQRASQVSTSYHSTSKWVLGYLARNGWLYGRKRSNGILFDDNASTNDPARSTCLNNHQQKLSCETPMTRTKNKVHRRETRLLEIGAINTELLDAASATISNINERNMDDLHRIKKYHLHVHAIDLHSIHSKIEQEDFLKLKVHYHVEQRYDVVVCSMVVNCIPTAEQRGDMMARLYHVLVPGGMLFLTLPLSCLRLSPYMDRNRFVNLLQHGLGFQVLETKDSPKVAFFICQRPDISCGDEITKRKWDAQWSISRQILQGKKYRNDFQVILTEASHQGKTITYHNDEF